MDEDMLYMPPLIRAVDVDEAADLEAPATLEASFASILHDLMRDELSTAEAVQLFNEVCMDEVSALRDHASVAQGKAASFLVLRGLAEELEAQASTWHLLLQLYCSGLTPAGLGGPQVRGVGERRTYRQALRDAVTDDPLLLRVAQVVAWLEAQAAQRMDAKPAPVFRPNEGAWNETRLLGHRSPRGTGPPPLDFDAPTRGALALQPGDAVTEERIAAALFQLVRAGRFPEARALARRVGQPYRAAILAGGGPFGPLPVGAAAAAQDADLSVEETAAEMALEVEMGFGCMRHLWRWACLNVAEAAAASTPVNRHEAALYGALAGSVAAVLPVCPTWEDQAWALCRAWLDLGAEEALPARAGALEASPLPPDKVAAAAAALAAGGGGGGGARHAPAAEVALGCMGAARGAWPPPRLRVDGSGRRLLPEGFVHLAALLAGSDSAAVRAAAASEQRVLQTALIAEQWDELVASMAGWVISAGAGDGAGADPLASALLRFAAHLALALRALGLLRDPRAAWDSPQGEGCARQEHMLSRVLGRYCRSLIHDPQHRHLAPPYMCHVRQPLREALLDELMHVAIQDPEGCPDEEGRELYAALSEALADWHRRQAALDAELACGAELADAGEGAPSNYLYGDVRPEELRQLFDALLSRARRRATDGPAARAALCRWLHFPFITAQPEPLPPSEGGMGSEEGEEEEGAGLLTWQPAFGDALALTVAVGVDLALGPGPVRAALGALLAAVPPEFPEYVDGSLAAMRGGGEAADEEAAHELEGQLQALAWLRRFAELDAAYADAKAALAAAAAGGGGGGGEAAAAAADAAHEVAANLLALAAEDPLASLAEPPADAAGGLAPLEAPAQLQLRLTAPLPPRGGRRGGAAAAAEAPPAQYPALDGADAAALQATLQRRLRDALADWPDVGASVEVAPEGVPGARDASAAAQPHALTVTLEPWAGEGTDPSEGGWQSAQRAQQAWQQMCVVGAWLLSGSCREEGQAAPACTLLAVDVGSFQTRMQLLRRRSTAKLMTRCAKLLLRLAEGGHRSPLLDQLVEAAAGTRARSAPLQRLMGTLDVRRLLQLVGAAWEAAPDADLLRAAG